MKLKFKEDPREWRKSALLTLLGIGLLSSLARWRHFLSTRTLVIIYSALGLLALLTLLRPHWFRSYYRLSLRLGFYSSQFLGRCVLLLFFLLVLSPVGWLMRLSGKDLLQLKHSQAVNSYWQKSKKPTSLERLF